MERRLIFFILLSLFLCGVAFGQEIGVGRGGEAEPEPSTTPPPKTPIDGVKIVNGTSWRGRLRVKVNGTWGAVCNYQVNDMLAQVACRMLGKVAMNALLVTGNTLVTDYHEKVLVDRLRCRGTENSLSECDYIDYDPRYKYCSIYNPVGIDCGAPILMKRDVEIRLNDQTTAKNRSFALTNGRGMLEVRIKGDLRWGHVCQKNFHVNEAEVVCRMLGYSTEAATPAYYSLFGWELREHWISEVNCQGYEAHLMDCRVSNTWGRKRCQGKNIVGVDCMGRRAFTVNGTKRGYMPHNGVVQLSYHGGTRYNVKPMCSTGFTDDVAALVCRDLGFVKVDTRPKAYKSDMFDSYASRAWLENYRCPNNATTFADCTYPYIGSNRYTCTRTAAVDCTNSLYFSGIRLVGGYDDKSGRLELQRPGMWRSMCYKDFTDKEAKVVCRMLGFSEANAGFVRRKFGEGDSRKVWTDKLYCTAAHIGKNLFECTQNIYAGSCKHYDDIGISCYDDGDAPIGQNLEVRLIGGYSKSVGHVEIYYNQKWNSICNDKFDDNAAKVVCKMAGFVTTEASVIRTFKYGMGNGEFLLDDVICDGNETNIMDCEHRQVGVSDCSPFEAVAVDCHGRSRNLGVRLTEGRVEVEHHSTWGSVCDDSVTEAEVKVICRQLGLGSTNATWSSYGSQKLDGPIWVDELKCSGQELTIGECKYNPLGEHNCDHGQDLFVSCN